MNYPDMNIEDTQNKMLYDNDNDYRILWNVIRYKFQFCTFLFSVEDECALGIDNCHEHAMCIDHDRGYQ
jgi:hypothetical protein